MQHTGVCQEDVICTAASFMYAGLNADVSHSVVRARQYNKLFRNLLWPINLLLWGFFVGNLSLGKKPRNTGADQTVHCDRKDELTSSAVICTSRRAEGLPPSSAFCLPETVSGKLILFSFWQVSGEATTSAHRTESDVRTRTCRLHKRSFAFLLDSAGP